MVIIVDIVTLKQWLTENVMFISVYKQYKYLSKIELAGGAGEDVLSVKPADLILTQLDQHLLLRLRHLCKGNNNIHVY